MKKIFGFLICALLISVRVYGEDDIPTERIYNFDRANVASVLAEYIEDADKATAAAERYNKLVENEENKISAVDFIDVCAVGGLKIKAADTSGYAKCLEMFMKLIEMQNLEAGDFNMYCPAEGNALKSITDKTRVGEICGGTDDTYIEFGYVTVKAVDSNTNKNVSMSKIKQDKAGEHKYICTCTAQSCKPGYHWDNYQCEAGKGYCDTFELKETYNTEPAWLSYEKGDSEWDRYQKDHINKEDSENSAHITAFKKCGEYARDNKLPCKVRTGLAKLVSGSWTNGKYKIVCNISDSEYESWQKERTKEYSEFHERAEWEHLKARWEQDTGYVEICGNPKSTGICIDDVFSNKVIGGVQVNPRDAAFLAEEYARAHYNDEIKCKVKEENIRKVWPDYFIQCMSFKYKGKYYEFKFDDVKESFDDVIRRNVDRAICEKIYGFKLNGNICKTSKEDCINKIIPAYRRYYGDGREHAYYGKDMYAIMDYTHECRINYTPLLENSKLSNDFGDKLDNYAFCKNTHSQLRNDDNLVILIKEYMSSQLGINKSQIECVPGSKKWPGGCGAESRSMLEEATNPSDNLISCHVGDKWVDFVFDDVHEFSDKLTEVSLDAMQCVISGHELSVKLGVELDTINRGKKCIGLDDKLCAELDIIIKKHGGSGAHYDTKKMACIINSAQEYAVQEFWTNMGISAVVAVGSVVMVIGSGGVATPLVVGGVTMAIETAINGSFYVVEVLEDGQAGRRFRRFIDAAKKCTDSKCARKVIEDNYNDLASVEEDYNYKDAAELQEELDRLFDLMSEDMCIKDKDGNVLRADSKGGCDLVLLVPLDLKAADNTLEYANFGLMIGSFAFNPETVMMKIMARGGRFVRILSKFKKLDSYRVKSIYYKIEDGFDMKVFGIKTSGGELRVKKSKLSDEEWEILRKDLLEKDNLIITATNDGYFVIHPDINALKNRASEKFDQYLQQCMSGGGCVGLPKSRLSDDEWNQLNKYVRDQGMALFEREMLNEKTGKWELVMQFEDFDPSGIRQGHKVNLNYSVFNGGGDINSLLRGFNKTPILRSGSKDIGYDYYRIMINDGDDVEGIVRTLRNNGYYVSSNKADDKKFLAVSKDDIFGPWANSKNNWLKIYESGNTGSDINSLLRGFNKTPVFRSGRSNTLGYDYYRIMIDDNDDVAGIVNTLKNNGYYVTGRQDKYGAKFLAVSKENIFGEWDVSVYNWLKGYTGGSARGLGIFDKIYNDVPDDVLKAKLQYVYMNSATKADAIEALKAVGAFDERVAMEMAQDIAQEVANRIVYNAGQDFIEQMRRWPSLSAKERETLIYQLHEFITTTRRKHVGNTIVGVFNDPDTSLRGRYWVSGDKKGFDYNSARDSLEGLLSTLIHENIHALQDIKKSSIHPAFVKLGDENYVSSKENYYLYLNNILEIESRYVGDNAAAKIMTMFGLR